jgi:uncharacterized protein YfaS (alpha-2-macroglobulin family)
MSLKQFASRIISVIVTISLLLSGIGCGAKATPLQPTATPSVTGTPTRTSTRTHVPSFTRKPTNTPRPTNTPLPTATPTPRPPVDLDSQINPDKFPPDGAVVVRFDEAMDIQSSLSPLVAFPLVEGTTHWSQDRTALTFQPARPLEPDKAYTFFLDPALQTQNAQTLLETYQWQIRVDGGPQVDRITPAAGKIDSRRPLISVRFDRSMLRDRTQAAISVQPAVSFETDWVDDNTVRILLSEPLELGVRYDFLILAAEGDIGAVDKNGYGLATPYVWSYWLDTLTTSVSTVNEKMVEVDFSRPLQMGDSSFPFLIQPALAGSWQWKSKSAAVFTADGPIPLGRRYTLKLTEGLQDEIGPLRSVKDTFTFTAPPPVQVKLTTGYNSLDNNYYDWAYSDLNLDPISVVFSVPVDHASAVKAFSLSPSVPGELTWSRKNGEDVLEFRPIRLLEPGTSYEIRFLPSLLDVNGQKVLVDPYVYSFNITDDRYYSAYLYPSFGLGSNSQVVDADGWRYVQYGGEDDVPAHFELYGYSLNDFVGLYANEHGDRQDWTSSVLMPIPAEGKTPVADWWQEPKSVSGEESYGGPVLETAIPAEVPPGLYVLNYREKGLLYDQLFVALTKNTLVLKLSGDELFAWLTDIHGKSVPDAEIRLYSTRGEVFQEGTTDENGLFTTPLSRDYKLMLVSARVYGSNGEDVTIAGLDYQWYNGYTDYYYSVPPSRYSSFSGILAYIYTDRPIYRPGQAVNYKAILRRDKDVNYSLLPAGTPVKVNIRDSRSNLLESFDLTLNDFGSMNGSFQLVDDAVLGDYSVEIVVEGETHSQTFKVEEYRKPDFQVSIKTTASGETSNIVVGDEFTLEAEASYFFGEPLKDYNFTINTYYMSPSYYGWDEVDEPSYIWMDTQSVKTKTTETDGKLIISVRVPQIVEQENWYWYSPRAWTFAVEVEVDDGSKQTVSASYVFNVYRAAETVSVETNGYFQEPNVPFFVRASVKDINGQPVVERKLSLTFGEWDDNYWNYKPTSQAYDLITDAKGEAELSLSMPSGWYRLDISGLDVRGNSISDSSWMYVFKSPDDWIHRTQQEIRLAADEPAYKPYQTARLLIESTFSGPALLTFERGSVINSQLIQLTAPFTVVETKVLPEYAPNVYIKVNAWESSKRPATTEEYDHQYWGSNIPECYLRTASLDLKVDAGSNALQVEISTDKQEYAPGEKAQVTITVKDAQGKPARAEVSLAVVDEAIFGLSAELTDPIFKAFYGHRGNVVSTYDSMEPDRIIVEPGGRGSGGGGLEVTQLRNDFQDTAAWFPSLYSNTQGKVRVEVPLPDNLTSWRLTARAITLGSRVGQNNANIEVKQALMVRPVLPRILTVGDQTVLTTFIHNYSGQLQTIDVSMESAGLEIQGKAVQKVTVSEGQAKPVIWPVIAQNVGEAKLKFTAAGPDGLADAISLSIPIQPAAVPSSDTFVGDFTGNLSLAVPMPLVIPGSSTVTLQLDRSQAGSLTSGLEYLTGYPYGCIEQIMSRALPNAVVSRAAALLGLDPGLWARVDPLVNASIKRLYGMQHSDGGWGWWYDDATDDYQTAWVTFGLALISQAGYDIDPQVIGRAANYLDKRLQAVESEMDVRTQAYAIYALALFDKADPAMASTLLDNWLNELDTFSQAALALAFDELGDQNKARTILEAIDLHAIRSRGEVLWYQASQDGEYHQKTMASSLRTTALVLDAYLKIMPKSDLISGMVAYLESHRHGTEGWGTTNETTYAILALTDYLVTQRQQKGSLQYQVKVGDEVFQSGTLASGTSSVRIEIPVERLKLGVNSLSVSTDEAAHLYYGLTMDYGVSLKNAIPRSPYKLTRQYLDAASGAVMDKLSAGQLVKVQLEITNPEDLNHAILVDHLPAGLEAVNEGLNTTSHGYETSGDYDYYYEGMFFWNDYGYNFKDIRDDQVDFFFTVLPSGQHVYTYLARATFTGQFVALPAEVFAMYDLSKWGRSDSRIMVIQE